MFIVNYTLVGFLSYTLTIPKGLSPTFALYINRKNRPLELYRTHDVTIHYATMAGAAVNINPISFNK